MTAEQWESGADPEGMLLLLRGRASDRKLLLFACACCFRCAALNRLSGPILEQYGRTLEFADHPADRSLIQDWVQPGGTWCWPANPWSWAWDWVIGQPYDDLRPLSGETMAGILRCVFGNPSRPATIDPALLTPTVVSLARSAYDDPILPPGGLDSQRLGVLADALEEAGAAEDLLIHLRAPGPHVRGCWAVDRCLGRS